MSPPSHEPRRRLLGRLAEDATCPKAEGRRSRSCVPIKHFSSLQRVPTSQRVIPTLVGLNQSRTWLLGLWHTTQEGTYLTDTDMR